jgi:hypothetical protein
VTVGVEGNGRDPSPMRHRFIDVPEIVSGIGGDMDWKLVGGTDSLLEEGAKIGDVGFIQGQGVLG